MRGIDLSADPHRPPLEKPAPLVVRHNRDGTVDMLCRPCRRVLVEGFDGRLADRRIVMAHMRSVRVLRPDARRRRRFPPGQWVRTPVARSKWFHDCGYRTRGPRPGVCPRCSQIRFWATFPIEQLAQEVPR